MSEQEVSLEEFEKSNKTPSSGRIETPIGELPLEWGVASLDDICNINPDGFSEDEWPEKTFEYISLSNVSEGTILQSDTVPIDDAPSRAQRGVKVGDVLVGTVRPKQVSHGLVTEEHDGKICSSGFGVLRSPANLNAFYLLQEVLSRRFFRQMEAYVAGSGYPAVKIGDLRKHRIAVPSLEEQRKIASVLYTVDQAIQKTEEIIDRVDGIQKGLTSELFTKGPRDSTTETRRLGPVLTELPEHWQTAKIKDLYSDRQLGTGERGTTEDSEQIDLIKMGNLDFGTWNFSDVEKIERDPELLDEVALEKGDLLFNTRNTPELVGKTAVWEYDREAIYDNNLLRLRFGERISSGHYVNYYLSSALGRRQLRGRVHGTTSVAAIYWTDLQEVEIPVPPLEEQKEITEKLRSLDEVHNRNEKYRDQLQGLKKGLMQDLLSGEVRTHDKDIGIAEEVLAHG